jgi:hypothetical protein
MPQRHRRCLAKLPAGPRRPPGQQTVLESPDVVVPVPHLSLAPASGFLASVGRCRSSATVARRPLMILGDCLGSELPRLQVVGPLRVAVVDSFEISLHAVVSVLVHKFVKRDGQTLQRIRRTLTVLSVWISGLTELTELTGLIVTGSGQQPATSITKVRRIGFLIPDHSAKFARIASAEFRRSGRQLHRVTPRKRLSDAASDIFRNSSEPPPA